MDIQTLIVSVAQAAQALATTKQTVYSLHSSDPNFPRIFKIGKRRSGLLFSELEKWIKHRYDYHQISQTRAGKEGVGRDN